MNTPALSKLHLANFGTQFGFKLAIAIAAAVSIGFSNLRAQNPTLEAAAKAMGGNNLNAIQVTASGSSFAFGQSFKPGGPWPAFKVTSFSQIINLADPSMRIELDRTNPDGPVQGGGGLPLAAPQKQIQAVNGRMAWNMGVGPAGTATPALNTADERLLMIWMSPIGVVRAAQQNNATANGRTLSFTAQGRPIKATLGADNTVTKVETIIDAPVTGDTALEWEYSGYKDFNGIKYPSRMVQRQGGHPILDLTVSDVRVGGGAATHTPPNVAQAAATPPPASPAPQPVTLTKVGEGVHHATGGSHHSMIVEFADHVVLFEVPQSDARATAVIEATKKAFPNKPIKYVVNSHHHFDHAGGIRAAMAEGLTIITQAQNKPYYERIAAMPHTINPDRLSKAPKRPVIEGVDSKRVLSDATQTLELHWLPTNHVDTMLVGYLPKSKQLFEVDVYTPAGNAAPSAAPTPINPVTAAFADQLAKMGLEVTQLIPGHGPRLVTVGELRTVSGKSSGN
jgi:glyoxylase-like metal-dependent hydrolase (beta-lactamase superfamily II)